MYQVPPPVLDFFDDFYSLYDRDALSDLAIHFLDKIKTMVIKDIEREDIEFVCKTLGCRPIASLDHFTAENLVNVDLVEEVNEPAGKYIKVRTPAIH